MPCILVTAGMQRTNHRTAATKKQKASDRHRNAQKYDSHAKGLKCNGGPHGRHQDGHSEAHDDDHQEEDRQEEATDLALREAREA